jgi:hypothetical protein
MTFSSGPAPALEGQNAGLSGRNAGNPLEIEFRHFNTSVPRNK